MIAHVAESAEDRGRVVVRVPACGGLSAVALQAAVRLAQAYGSDIECLTIDDGTLAALSGLGVVREVSLSGLHTGTVEPGQLARDFRVAGRLIEHSVAELAAPAGVILHVSRRAGQPMPVLASACAAIGPWNVVVLAEPLDRRASALVQDMLASVENATGIVACGPRASRVRGRVLIVVDDLERLAALLRSATRLASTGDGDAIGLILMGADPDHVAWMEAQARLAIGASQVLRIEAAVSSCGAAGILPAVHAAEAGFVVARLDSLIADGGDLWTLAQQIACPLLLMR